jgi:phage terminase large subunit
VSLSTPPTGSTLQIETARIFVPLIEPARYKGAWGGRGSGKSHFFAELLIDYAIAFPGLRAVCVREVQKSLAQSVKRLLEDKIAAMGVGSLFNVLQTHIETPGGGLIIFQGMQNHTAESIKSLEGYGVAWVEEAQSLSQRSLDLLRPTIRDEGSELWFSWNPRSEKDPIEALLRGPQRIPDAVVVKANWSNNPRFPNVLRDEKDWDQKRDPDKYAHIWLGEYQRNSEARVFHNWTVDEFDTPDDARFYLGADWGFSVDPTVLVRCFIDGRKLYVDHEAWQIGCEIDRTPALFEKVPGARKWPIKADSSNPQSISYMRRQGFDKITASVKGPGSVEEGVEFLKGYDMIVHTRCRHVADELATYSYEVDRQTEEVLPKLADKKNHTIDALRYAIEGVRRAPAEPVFATYGSR